MFMLLFALIIRTMYISCPDVICLSINLSYIVMYEEITHCLSFCHILDYNHLIYHYYHLFYTGRQLINFKMTK